jgi:hypothetical protein
MKSVLMTAKGALFLVPLHWYYGTICAPQQLGKVEAGLEETALVL